jgi:hypothetical protein
MPLLNYTKSNSSTVTTFQPASDKPAICRHYSTSIPSSNKSCSIGKRCSSCCKVRVCPSLVHSVVDEISSNPVEIVQIANCLLGSISRYVLSSQSSKGVTTIVTRLLMIEMTQLRKASTVDRKPYCDLISKFPTIGSRLASPGRRW